MFIKEIRLQNLLSFGPDTPSLELRPLNVLIGPNGSGKSNLIEAISILQAAPNDISEPFARGGGANEWIWKGANDGDQAIITARAALFGNALGIDVLHQMHLSPMKGLGIGVLKESLLEIEDNRPPVPVYRGTYSSGTIKSNGEFKDITLTEREGHHSILSLRRDPQYYRSITNLSADYTRIRIYRDWSFGRGTVVRVPQPAVDFEQFLKEDLSNLALTISRLLSEPSDRDHLYRLLEKLADNVCQIGVANLHDTVQIYLHEGSRRIPATRLSDGTLRYICLLAILCDPNPPPLVCIEEPELGLHPDMLPTITDLLRQASHRTQVVVTTHSDLIVDALTNSPEDVVVCEKHDGCTTMRRLARSDLSTWLEKYSLGDLWTRGQIGGNRW
jgi:predicted ATPase